MGKLEYLSFKYIEKIPSDWEKQHRNGSGSHCVMVQWIHPPGLAFSQPVTLRCRELWTLSPPRHGLLHFPSFHPHCWAAPGSLAPTARVPPWSVIQQHSWVSRRGGRASSPQLQPRYLASPAPSASSAYPPSCSLPGVYNDSFPQRPLNYLACSCLLLSSNC